MEYNPTLKIAIQWNSDFLCDGKKYRIEYQYILIFKQVINKNKKYMSRWKNMHVSGMCSCTGQQWSVVASTQLDWPGLKVISDPTNQHWNDKLVHFVHNNRCSCYYFALEWDFNYYCTPILCPDSQTLRAFFSKSTFHWSAIMIWHQLLWHH